MAAHLTHTNRERRPSEWPTGLIASDFGPGRRGVLVTGSTVLGPQVVVTFLLKYGISHATDTVNVNRKNVSRITNCGKSRAAVR